MNNVSMLTFFWPPDRTSGVWCLLRFAKYLPQSAWLSTVVTRGCILTCRVDCENKNRVSGDVQRVRPIGDEDLTWIPSWVLMPVLRFLERIVNGWFTRFPGEQSGCFNFPTKVQRTIDGSFLLAVGTMQLAAVLEVVSTTSHYGSANKRRCSDNLR